VSSIFSREKESIEKMLVIYCEGNHRKIDALCPDCQFFLEYITERLDNCEFGKKKPLCSRCPNHCYSKNKRTKTVDVMRFSGPRMLYKHPILALFHLIDALKRGSSF